MGNLSFVHIYVSQIPYNISPIPNPKNTKKQVQNHQLAFFHGLVISTFSSLPCTDIRVAGNLPVQCSGKSLTTVSV